MSFKQCLIISVIGIALATITHGSSIYIPNSERNLMSFMARSNNLLAQNPARSLECFNYYIPLINKLAEEYEANYKACLNASEINRANADNATWGQRNDLALSAEASCNLLSQCGESGSVPDVFECYISGGSSNINTMYGINANASEALANLKEQYYLIESKENRCTNETKRAYERDSAEAYANLNDCIQGKSDVPTAAPSTVSTATPPTAVPSTETPSAGAPSTEDPSNAAPPTDASAEQPNGETPN